jgi:hypothetical protein
MSLVTVFVLIWVSNVKIGIIDACEPALLEECVGWVSRFMWFQPIFAITFVWLLLTLFGEVVDKRIGGGARASNF